MKGYKAFNKDMTCRGFQFKEDEIYKTDDAIICQKGFHFCENPLDVLNYYSLCESEFCEVESLPDAKTVKSDDGSKVATTKIKIKAKLNLESFIRASLDFLFKHCKTNYSQSAQTGDFSQSSQTGHSSQTSQTGDYSKSAQSGDYSKSAQSGDYSQSAQSGNSSQSAQSGNSSQSSQTGNYSQSSQTGNSSQSSQTGDYSKSAQSGDYSKLEINGKHSVGTSIGIGSKIKGKKGNWITLAEWKYDNKKERHIPVCVKSVKIDGERIKEDTFYRLKDGEFTEVDF